MRTLTTVITVTFDEDNDTLSDEDMVLALNDMETAIKHRIFGQGVFDDYVLVDDWTTRSLVDDDARALDAAVKERHRQRTIKGFKDERDDTYTRGELIDTALNYAAAASITGKLKDAEFQGDPVFDNWRSFSWPWERRWWKPGTPQRMLEKAIALLLAELARLDRLAQKTDR